MVLCDYLVLRATWPRSAPTAAGLARTVRVADALAAARCEPHATDARLLAARTALELGQRDVADRRAGEVPGLAAVRVRSSSAPGPGTPRRCCGCRPATGAAPSPRYAPGCPRRAAPDHPRRDRAARARLRSTAPSSPRSGSSWPWPTAGRSGSWPGASAGGPARCTCARAGSPPIRSLAEQLDRLRTTQPRDRPPAGHRRRHPPPGARAARAGARDPAARPGRRRRRPTAPAQVTLPQLRRQLAGSALVQYVEFKDALWAVVVTERALPGGAHRRQRSRSGGRSSCSASACAGWR